MAMCIEPRICCGTGAYGAGGMEGMPSLASRDPEAPEAVNSWKACLPALFRDIAGEYFVNVTDESGITVSSYTIHKDGKNPAEIELLWPGANLWDTEKGCLAWRQHQFSHANQTTFTDGRIAGIRVNPGISTKSHIPGD